MKKFFNPKIFIVVAVFSWDPSSFGAETSSPTQIHVRHEAQIAASNVELGAVADISSTSIDDERALSSLILGESPQTGKAVEWTAAEISKRLRPYSRILKDAQIKLPDHIVIRRVVSGFTRDVLKVQIEESLKATLPDSTWEARVTELNIPPGIEIPRDGSVQVVPPVIRPRGATNIEVLVVADGQVVKRVWVPCRMSYFARVPTLVRQIDARTRVNESDIKWDRREVTYMMDVPVTPADMSNSVAKTTLVPGAILNRSQLEREMALKFGQEVELTAGDEDFSISAKGIAQQNGFIGDTVKVKNVATNKIIDGVVTGSGIVHVRF